MNSSEKLINVSSRQLLAFVEASRVQSFAQAAERVHLSPSGMSMLVKEMEEQVGARLFDRTTRSVSLTDAGRRLVPVAERIVDELRSVGALLGGVEAAVRSRLDVAATPMISSNIMPLVLRDFADTHPQVRIHLADVDVGAVRRRVMEGEADVGFGFFVKPAVGLVRKPLCRFQLMHISPPARGTSGMNSSQPWSSITTTSLLGLPPDNPIQALIEANLTKAGRASGHRATMNLLGTLIGMVRAGVGHAIVPSFALEQCLRDGLSVAMLTRPAVHLELFMVSRRGAASHVAASDLAASVKRIATQLSG